MAAQSSIQIHENHDDVRHFIHFYNIKRDKNLVLIQTGSQQKCHSKQLRPRVRDHYLLHFVKSGSGCLHLQNSSYPIGSNDCFLIYPNELSLYHSTENCMWEYYWLGISGTFAEELIALTGFSHDRQVAHFTSPAIFDTLMQLLDAAVLYQNDIYALELKTNGLLYELFSILYLEKKERHLKFHSPIPEDNAALFGIGSSSRQWVKTIVALIQENYNEDLRVDNIADYLHLNRSYLSSLFKQETGLSIKQYLSYYRIEAAKKKLLNTAYSVSQISFQCGFKDPLYFSRIFHECVGLSPSEFRQSDADNAFKRPKINPVNIDAPPETDDYFLTY